MAQEVNTTEHRPSIGAEFLDRNRCPSCDATQISPAEVFSDPPAESFKFDDLKKFFDDTFKEKAFSEARFAKGERVFFSYHRCRNCGLLFCRKYFTPDQLQQLYGATEDNSGGLSNQVLQKTQQGYFNVLKKFSPLEGKLLEIGPDIGLFTEICARQGKFERFWLFESNRDSWTELKKSAGDKKSSIHENMFDLAPIPDHALSVAVAIHVMDHMVNPKSMLVEIRKKLKPSSILLMVTHNEGSLLTKIIGKKWPPYSLFHPELYNPSSMKSLLESAGYSVLSIGKTANVFPVTHFIKHGLRVLGVNFSLPEMAFLHVPVKLGNIITIARPN